MCLCKKTTTNKRTLKITHDDGFRSYCWLFSKCLKELMKKPLINKGLLEQTGLTNYI